MMRLSKLSEYLDLIISNQDVQFGKPDPMMYLLAMKTLGVSSDECLILEDNEHGIQAAVASGGHLLKIGLPEDVTYQAIKTRVNSLKRL
jgi:HAD superfamily hydrolase (TIGR01509 family)